MSAVLWPVAGRIATTLNQTNGTSDHETAMRLLKVVEEAGEASAAYIGMTGQNPRKGITHTPADVADELCDVIIAAAVALHTFTATPAADLFVKLNAVASRLDAAAQPAGDAQAASCCPAAHADDRTACMGPVCVTILDALNAGSNGCEHHAARLLAWLDGGRVYALPDAPEGAALWVFTTAAHTPPYAWITNAPGVSPDDLVTVELDCDDWPEPHTSTLPVRELTDLLADNLGRITVATLF